MAATRQLIADGGPGAVTHQRVAELAAVSRSTLYRYWPQADDLLFAAVAEIVTRFEFAGPGTIREELTAELKRWRGDLNEPVVRIAFMAIMARALHDSAAANVRKHMLDGLSREMREAVDRGVARGELRPGLDPDLLAMRVMGAVTWRSMVQTQRMTDSMIEEIVSGALAGWEVC